MVEGLLRYLGLAICGIVLVSGSAGATLVGDQIHGSLVFSDFPQLGNIFDPADAAACCGAVPAPPGSSGIQPLAVVTEDDSLFPEFVFNDFNPNNPSQTFLDILVDVDGSSVAVSVIDTSSIPVDQSDTPLGWTITLSDLQWTDDPNGYLVDAVIVPDNALFPGLTVAVSSGGDALTIVFPGRGSDSAADALAVWRENGRFDASISLETNHSIPEPGTFALLGLGLAGLGFAQRGKAC